MKHFGIVSFVCLLLGWGGSIATHAWWSIRVYGSVEGGDTEIVAYWSFIFMLLAYGLFILLPKKWIIKAVDKFNFPIFVLLSSIYSLITFTLLIGWLFLVGNSFLGVFLDASTIGIIFGITFWSFRKHIQSKE